MRKGPIFEREICKQFSEWWDGSDDCFWRTHSSGARATSRSKKGKTTRGQYGDMCSVDTRGLALTKLITFSFKRGYAKTTIGDLIDAGERNTEPMFSKWIREAIRDSERAGTDGWMIIIKRNHRSTLAVMNMHLKMLLMHAGAKALNTITPQSCCIAKIAKNPRPTKLELKAMSSKEKLQHFRMSRQVIYVCRLESFLKVVNKNHVRLAYRRTK